MNQQEGRLKPLQDLVLSYNSGEFLVEFARICLLKKEENKTHSLYSTSSLPVRKVEDKELLWLGLKKATEIFHLCRYIGHFIFY